MAISKQRIGVVSARDMGWLTLFLFFLTNVSVLLAKENNVAILISKEIGPYVSMVQGFEAEVQLPVQRFFLDEEGQPYSLTGSRDELHEKSHDAFVAVGPEALHFCTAFESLQPLVYGMVLHPEKVTRKGQNDPCGISLNIPPAVQLQTLLRSFPSMKRLGVLFDPKNNLPWFKKARDVAHTMGIDLVPLQVTGQRGLAQVSAKFDTLDAILFIPDTSIISKTFITYVIKQGLLKHIPIVGYNTFFHESGAALSFIIDYKAVGAQVARQVQRVLHGQQCDANVYAPFMVKENFAAWNIVGNHQDGFDKSERQAQ